MTAALDKRVSMEFVDEGLEDALTTIAAVTGINVIVDPRVREKKLKLNLRVRAMEVSNVLKWMARLTDTYIEVLDQALYFTDKASAAEDDEERQEALAMMIRVGVDRTLLPPAGQPLTDQDRLQIALAILEKEVPKPTDFPAPEIDLERNPDSFLANPFGARP
jgi:type II secretory pathway component GspD/PulD (secretin)